MHTLEYCDYIADLIHENILINDVDGSKLLRMTSPVKYDLSPEGFLNSTKKTITVSDKNGLRYRITVEKIND